MVEEIKFFKDSEKTLQVYPDMKIESAAGEAKNFKIEDAANASAKFTIYGETEQETNAGETGSTITGIGSITATNVDTSKQHKLELKGNTVLDSVAEVAGTTLTGSGVTASNVDTTNEHVITTGGNTVQYNTTGKNLIDTSGFTSDTFDGVTITKNADGTFNFVGTGTAGATGHNIGNNFANKIEVGKYYHIYVSCSTSNINLYGSVSGGNIVTTEAVKSYSTSPSSAYLRVFLMEGKEYNLHNVKVMIAEVPNRNTFLRDKDYEPEVFNSEHPQEINTVGSNINLFNKNDDNIIKDAFINADSKYKIEATVGAGRYTIVVPVQSNTTYTISKKLGSVFTVGYINTTLTPDMNVLGTITDNTATSLTISTGNSAKYLLAYIINTNEGDDRSEILNSIKVEKGAKATGYTKYNAGSMEVKVSNKNLFDITELDDTTSNIKHKVFYVKPNTNYTLSTTSGWNYSNAYLFLGESPCHFPPSQAAYNGHPVSINSSSEGKVYIGYRNDFDPADWSIQLLEEGSTATTFVAHQEQTVTIPLPAGMELCKIGNYQDYIYRMGCNWYKYKTIEKIILDGTQGSWTKGSASGETYSVFQANFELNKYVKNTTEIFSDKIIGGNNTSTLTEENIQTAATANSAIRISILNSRLSEISSNGFNTYLSNNNFTCYIPLATPVIEQITDVDTLAALNQLDNFTLYDTYTAVMSSSGDIGGSIKLRYNATIESPSPNKPAKLITVGDEHINLYKWNDAGYIQDVQIVSSAIASASGKNMLWIPCKSNTTYTISKDNTTGSHNIFQVGTTSAQPATGVSVSDVSSHDSYANITITTSAQAKYLVCTYYDTSDASVISDEDMRKTIKIEEGNIATGYTRYNQGAMVVKIGDGTIEKNITIPLSSSKKLCRIDAGSSSYEDYIYKNKWDNKWYKYKTIHYYTLNGTETWTKGSGTSADYWYYNYNTGITGKDGSHTMSTLFKGTNIYTTNSNIGICHSGVNLRIRYNPEMTNTQFKNWIKDMYDAGTPLTVYHALDPAYESLIEAFDPTSADDALTIAALDELASSDLYTPTTIITAEGLVDTKLELKYNYMDASPSVDKPGKINTIGSNINIFNKDSITELNTLNAYIDDTTHVIVDGSSGGHKTIFIPCKSNTTYTISKPFVSPKSSNIFRVGTTNQVPTIGDVVNDYIGHDNSGSFYVDITLTTNPSAKYLCLNIYASGDTTITWEELLNQIKIEEGSTPTNYTEYNKGSVDFKIGNKNLLGGYHYLRTYSDVTMETREDGTVLCNGTVGSSARVSMGSDIAIPLHFNFTLKAGSYKLSGGVSNKFAIELVDITLTPVQLAFTGYSSSAVEFTLSEDKDVFVRIYAHASTQFNNEVCKPMLIESTAKTDYEEHKGQNKAVVFSSGTELCKIGSGQDYLYKMNGKWYKHKEINKYIFDGTETVSAISTSSSNDTVFIYYNLITDYLYNNSNICYCTHFISTVNGAFTDLTEGKCNFRFNNDNGKYFCMSTNDFSTKEDFANGLASQYANGTPVTVYYRLATPVEEEIIDPDTIEALETIYTYSGITYIDCKDSLQPTITVDYLYDNDINNYYGPRLDGNEARIRALERQVIDLNATILSMGGNV